MKDYFVANISTIEKNYYDIVNQCNLIKNNYDGDLTKNYHQYNIFSLTSGSVYFYDIYKFLNKFVREKLNKPNERMWFQAWLNYHKESEVLDWHSHEWDYHGYISIDPKNTITEFENYSIDNKVGQIYFGPGYRKHRVKVNSSYDDYRITIGFDVTLDSMMDTNCFGMFPLL